MSRLLILVLTAVAVLVGGINLYLSGPEAVAAANAQIDGQLGRAATAFSSVVAAGAQESLGFASQVAGNEGVTTVLADLAKKNGKPDEKVLDAAIQAIATASKDAEKAKPLVVVATKGGAAEFRSGEGNEFKDQPGLPSVRDALDGARTHVLATFGGAVVRVAAVPVAANGASVGAVAVGFPVDDAFVAQVREVVGADVTVLKGGQIVATTVATEQRATLVEAAKSGESFGFGELPAETFSLFGLVDLPLFGEADAVRARKAKLAGVDDVEVVVSAPATGAMAPVADAQKRSVFLGGVVLVLGLLFTGLARNKGGSKDDADELENLADTAERLAGGDTSAHAAEFLAGDLGRIARALNKLSTRARIAASAAPVAAPMAIPAPEPTPVGAADSYSFGEAAAEPMPAAAPSYEEPAAAAEPEPEPAGEEPAAEAHAEVPAPAPAPSGWELPATSGRSQTLAWGESPNTLAPGAHVLGQEPAAAPQNEAAPYEEPQHEEQQHEGFNPEATIVAAVPEALLRATTRAPSPARPAAPADPDEAHFQQVYQDFLSTRERCGESTAGLTYDKFQLKLHKNRTQLVEKYQCRTVRFAVYVKEGKAALKATPVKD